MVCVKKTSTNSALSEILMVIRTRFRSMKQYTSYAAVLPSAEHSEQMALQSTGPYNITRNIF
jgi:hypothetical protein